MCCIRVVSLVVKNITFVQNLTPVLVIVMYSMYENDGTLRSPKANLAVNTLIRLLTFYLSCVPFVSIGADR